ncbi:MAG: hypothetical protein ACI8WT_002988 [Clostridium sp.]|jgi:hypothetical protein
MRKKTFIPNWYLDKKILLRNKKIKNCIIAVSIVNIFLLSFILNVSNKIKSTNIKNSSENIISAVKTIKIAEIVKKDIIIIEKYKEFSDFFEDNNLSYKNITITEEKLEIDIEVENYEEYINVIKRIEEHYSINKLIPNIKNEGNFNFKVILKV